MSGSPLLPCLITLQALGAAGVGLNCSTGLTGMDEWIGAVLPHAAVPLIAKPNAMMKDAVGFDQNLDPDAFAQGMEILMDAGASIVGGCCGTTPAHLAALRRVADRHPTVAPPEIDVDAAAGERSAFFLTDDLEPSPLIDCDSNLPDALIEAEDDYNVARGAHRRRGGYSRAALLRRRLPPAYRHLYGQRSAAGPDAAMLSRQAAGGFGMRDRETTVGGYRRPIRRYRFLKIKI